MLKETTINDKNNTKVIAKLLQGHSKVKIAKHVKISTFYQIQLLVQQAITKTDFETLLIRNIFHTHF